MTDLYSTSVILDSRILELNNNYRIIEDLALYYRQ